MRARASKSDRARANDDEGEGIQIQIKAAGTRANDDDGGEKGEHLHLGYVFSLSFKDNEGGGLKLIPESV